MEKIKKQRWFIIAGIMFAQFIVMIILLATPRDAEPVEQMDSWLWESQIDVESIEDKESELIFWVVDVKGAVVNPGIYEVAKNMRIQDAIDLAGGLLADANTRQLNFAQHLEDQMLIYVPLVGEENETESGVPVSTPGKEMPGAAKMNINTADVTSLQELPGIGEKKAQQIIAHRTEKGSFQAIEDIMEVSGIGQKTFEGLRELITVSK